jgi:hypothetical protein
LESIGHFTRDDKATGDVLITLFNSMGDNGDNEKESEMGRLD